MNMTLELDHVFCFVDRELKEAQILSNKNFQLTEGSHHSGQGTANRCLKFRNAYLELIYLTSLEEASRNLLRLDLRDNWKETGMSPFGIGLRGALSEEERKLFFAHRPSYFDGLTLWVLKQCFEDKLLPMIFVIDSPNYVPKTKALNQEYSLDSVDIYSPDTVNWPLEKKIKGLDFRKGDAFRMEVTYSGRNKKAIELNPILALK